MQHASRFLSCSVLLFLVSNVSAQAQVDERLMGTWIGAGEANEGEKVIVEKNVIAIGGQRLPLRFVSRGVVMVGPAGEEHRLSYAIEGDVLTIKDPDETTTWRRSTASRPVTPPKPPSEEVVTPPEGGGNPLRKGGQDGKDGNPLARKAAADPFARKFKGEGIALELTGNARTGFQGTLTFRGDAYPARAQAASDTMRGTFRVQDQEFAFVAKLAGDALTLTSGGEEYRLTGERREAVPPEDVTPRSGDDQKPRAEAPLAPGMKRFLSEKAGVACDLPEAWTLLQEGPQGCVINPGFQKGQRLEVTVTLHCLPISAEQQGTPTEKLMADELPGMRQSLLENSGIKTEEPQAIEKLQVAGGKEAVCVSMRAELQQQKGLVWFALRIEGDKSLAGNAVFLGGKEATFLPLVQRVFATLRPAADASREPAPAPDRIKDLPAPESRDKNVLLLRKRTFQDPGFGGIDSHTMFLPEDWTGEGGVKWTKGTTNFVHFIGNFAGPDGLGVSFDYNRHFMHSTDRGMLEAQKKDMANIGSGVHDVAPPPQGPGEIAVRQVLPKLRPDATNVKIVEAKTSPEAEKKIREALAPTQQSMSQGVTTRIHCERVHASYDEGGRSWEELLQYTAVVYVMPFRTDHINYDTAMWNVFDVRTYRAPSGQLQQNRSHLLMIGETLQPTPRWSISYTELLTELGKIQHKTNMDTIAAIGERARKIAEANAQISDIRMNTWKQQQASHAGIHRATINSINEVHDYQTREGHVIPVDHSYEHVFEDGVGRLILTNDPSYDPSSDTRLRSRDWKPLKRIQHTGG